MSAGWGRFVYRWRWATLVVSSGLLLFSVVIVEHLAIPSKAILYAAEPVRLATL